MSSSTDVIGISQDETGFEHLPEGRGVIPKASWMYHAYHDLPLLIHSPEGWRPIRRSFLIPTRDGNGQEELEPVSIDQGNGFLKLGFQTCNHKLGYIALPSRIQVGGADNVRHGSRGRVTWRLGTPDQVDPSRLWVGDDALEGGRGFAVGATAERFEDELYLSLLKIGLVQALKAAGHQPGTYALAVGVGIRVPEVTIDEKSGQQRILPQVAAALARLVGTFVAEEATGDSSVVWTITVARIFPTIQPLGGYFLWGRNLLCDPSQTLYSSVGVLDWGTGDLGWVIARQRADRPLTLEGDVLSQGAVQMARAVHGAVKSQFPNLRFSLPDAQQAIIANQIEINGRLLPLTLNEEASGPSSIESLDSDTQNRTTQIARARDTKLHHIRSAYRDALDRLLVDANPALQDIGLFLLCVGGTLLNPLLLQKLIQRLKTLDRDEEGYLLAPEKLTISANALGLYVYTYWRLLLLREQTQ